MTARIITECQVCGDKTLESIIHLGWHPAVNAYHPIGHLPAYETHYPLHLVRCQSYRHVQIDCRVDPTVLFPASYPYRSRTTRVLRDNFDQLARECHDFGLFDPVGANPVVDIGSNDGTLLSYFKAGGCNVHGIDPAAGAADDAWKNHGIRTSIGYFSETFAHAVAGSIGAARIVTACNVFAHVPDVHDFVRGVAALLAPSGIFVSESHYLPSLLETVQYDTIYHEHLRYYDLGAIRYVLRQQGFEVFHAAKIPTHGGSIRVYASREPREKTPEYKALLEQERAALTDENFTRFSCRVRDSRYALLRTLHAVRDAAVFGIGAPSRAATLVNYCGLDDGILNCIAEVEGSPKIGRYMPGTVIPVVNERALYEQQPSYALILSWHVAYEIMASLRARGYRGKFIVPLPEVKII